MTTIVILNLFLATFVIVAVVGLLAWSIVRDRAATRPAPAQVRVRANAAATHATATHATAAHTARALALATDA